MKEELNEIIKLSNQIGRMEHASINGGFFSRDFYKREAEPLEKKLTDLQKKFLEKYSRKVP